MFNFQMFRGMKNSLGTLVKSIFISKAMNNVYSIYCVKQSHSNYELGKGVLIFCFVAKNSHLVKVGRKDKADSEGPSVTVGC